MDERTNGMIPTSSQIWNFERKKEKKKKRIVHSIFEIKSESLHFRRFPRRSDPILVFLSGIIGECLKWRNHGKDFWHEQFVAGRVETVKTGDFD